MANNDGERAIMSEKMDDSRLSLTTQSSEKPIYTEGIGEAQGLGRRFVDSFRRNPKARIIPPGVVGAHEEEFILDAAIQATASSPLARRLKSKHLQMITIGGSIGSRVVHPGVILC